MPFTQSDLLWSHNTLTTSAGKTKRFDFTPPIRLSEREPQRSPRASLSATAFRRCRSAEAQGAWHSLRAHMIPGTSVGGLAVTTMYCILDMRRPCSIKCSEFVRWHGVSDEGVSGFVWTFRNSRELWCYVTFLGKVVFPTGWKCAPASRVFTTVSLLWYWDFYVRSLKCVCVSWLEQKQARAITIAAYQSDIKPGLETP